MQCSNCGKTIPFTGRECPYCHANKEADKAAVVLGVGGTIGFVVGIAVCGTGWGVIVCIIVGMIPGTIKAVFR